MNTMTWETYLKEKINLLGHRNWIVVTDMAYPLQSQAGIDTFFADEKYENILSKINNIIQAAPHIQANIYQDSEINLLDETDIKGIDALKQSIHKVLGSKITYEEHEALIAKLDKVSQTFNVVIIKSNLTIPYTTTFFELDCKYWNEEKQKMLEKKK